MNIMESGETSRKALVPLRYHPMSHCLMLILRVLTAGATVGAVLLMQKSTQIMRMPFGSRTALWLDYPTFRWFVVANLVVFVYAILAALVESFALCTRRGPLSYQFTAWFTFIADFVLAGALVSALSAALAVLWIGKYGQATAGWGAVCLLVDNFCNNVQGALIECMCGWVFLVISTFIAASAFHLLAPHAKCDQYGSSMSQSWGGSTP